MFRRAVNSRREVGSRDYSGSIVTNSINVNVGGGEENTIDTSKCSHSNKHEQVPDMVLQLLNGKVEITK